MTAIAGRCEAYKRATANFLDWLALKQPSKPRTVRSILLAVQDLHSQGIVLPAAVEKSLRNAISLRRRVYRMYEERAQSRSLDDERHGHFIEALEKARVLLSAPNMSDHTTSPDLSDSSAILTTASAATRAADIATFANRFEMLEVADAPEIESANAPVGATETATYAPSSLIGERIIIENVVSKVELNGHTGRVLQYDESTGRYTVHVDGQQYSLKPSNTRVSPLATAEEERYLMGETVQFQAACLLLDIEGVLEQVKAAWEQFRHGGCSLLEAAARTNACVRHAERLASAVELETPFLNSLERVVCAAYLMRTVSWTQSFLSVSFTAALDLVSHITHGIPGETTFDTIGGQRVLFGVALAFRLAAAMGQAADPLVGKVRATVRRCAPAASDAQVDAVLARVTEEVTSRVAKPVLEAGAMQDPDDFYCGNNGLLLTSAFLCLLASPSTNVFKWPSGSSSCTARPGFFGPAWNEEQNPAGCTNDLVDYLGAGLPVLFSFAHGELRTSNTTQISMPVLKMKTLMPLWPLLETAMDKQAPTLALVVGVQALLLSLVAVNGDKRCQRIKVTTRLAVRRALAQIDHDLALCSDAARKGCPYAGPTKANLEMFRSYVEFTNRRHEQPPVPAASGAELSAISARHRDHVILENPWVAGQQLLVLTLGVGLGGGSAMLDNAGQASFALHLHNALRAARAAPPVPLLDHTLLRVLGGENKAVWFAGVPGANFGKAWAHRLGMSASTKANRKLQGLEPADLSQVYRCVAEADLSGVELGEGDEGEHDALAAVLHSISVAFAADPLVGSNLAALGTRLLGLGEHLIDTLGLHAKLEQTLAAEARSEGQSKGGGRGEKGRTRGDAGGGAGEKARRDAVYLTLAAELMFACEREVPGQTEPLHLGQRAGPGMDRSRLPRCSASERAVLEQAGRAVKEFVDKIQPTAYRML